jgi:site-specific DNA-methyltransferase (adenine-specific)
MLKHKKRNDIKQIVMPNTELRLKGADRHSRKPKEVRERIELLFGDIPRIELFARQNFSGWDAWGNEVSESVEINNVQPPNDMQCGVGKNNI